MNQVQRMSEQTPKTKMVKTGQSWLGRNATKVVIFFVALAILTAVVKMPARKRDAPPTEPPPVNVAVMNIVAEPQLADSFDLPAVVEPNQVVKVAAEVAGRVERVLTNEGSIVHAGDLLIQLNADLVRPQFEMAKAQVDRDQIEYERMTGLFKQNAAPRRDLDNATTQLAISKAQLDEVRARLDRTRILAPIGKECLTTSLSSRASMFSLELSWLSWSIPIS
jgi:multidrug efflux pump subunit AcrA (membrane-fusion protein)